MANVPDFIKKNRVGYKPPVQSRQYKYTPPIPAQAIQFEELPIKKDAFAQFQYLLTDDAGRFLLDAQGVYYLEPDI